MVNRAAAKLRAQLADKDSIIVCPGVQDGLSARVCLDEGFKNLYMVSPNTHQTSDPASSFEKINLHLLPGPRPAQAQQ